MAASNGTVYKALNRSIDAAAKAGRIDRDAQAALIASARKVARVMDDPAWPIIDGGKFDNVSPSTLLRYCEKLGICPELKQDRPKPEGGGLSKLRGEVLQLKAAK